MKVTLLNYTQHAMDLLLFTKSTRLNMTPESFDKIKFSLGTEKEKELKYIANTIPSSWEFVDYTFLVEGVSRAYTHQQVRTRSASYAQQSMRVTDQCEFGYIFTQENLESSVAFDLINEHNERTKKLYKLLTEKWSQSIEDARGILPTNISTNIVCKFNLRVFSDLVKQRSGGRTQNEYQQVVRLMADEVIKVHPWAKMFLYPKDRNYFDEIEAFAEREYGGNLIKKGELLKIVDKLRKEA